VLLDLIRQMSPEERLQRCLQFSATICAIGEAGLRERHPEATEREIFLLSARQKLGAELCRTVYGDPVVRNGSA